MPVTLESSFDEAAPSDDHTQWIQWLTASGKMHLIADFHAAKSRRWLRTLASLLYADHAHLR